MLRIFVISLILICSGCARLDHFQISDIDQSQGELKPISVKVSETGFDASETVAIASAFSSGSTQSGLEEVALILALINLGPSTGNPVYSDQYAENLLIQLREQCPSGKMTGIRSVREGLSYGPVSGEVVRLDADCIL